MPILDIGNIYICSWSKEFGIVLIPEVEFTSFLIHFVFHFRQISKNKYSYLLQLHAMLIWALLVPCYRLYPFLYNVKGLGTQQTVSRYLYAPTFSSFNHS